MDPFQPGSTLSHYRILRRLGAGGMGVVYEAEDLKLGRHVAVKLVAGGDSDPVILERFWREARTASALNHPGICTIHEINDTEQQPFLVMEMLEGQTLDRLYAGRVVPIPRLIELGVQLADALDAAHRKGILHRDIKPANIFVTTSGQAKMLDFGLARFHAADDTESTAAGIPADDMLTRPGTTLGTIAYMSPEQARGEPLDPRSDIFSLGVVLYEMSTGKHPFGGTTSAVIFDKLLNYLPPAPISLNHELPPDFEAILGKALEKDRDLRYQSAADLRADLRRLQRKSSASRLASAVTLPSASSYPGMTRADASAHPSAPPVATTVQPSPISVSAPGARFPGRRGRFRPGQGAPRPAMRILLAAGIVIVGLSMLIPVVRRAWHRAHQPPPAAAAPTSAAPAPPAPAPATSAPAVAATVVPAKPQAGTAAASESRPVPEESKHRHHVSATPPQQQQPATVVSKPVVASAAPAPVAPPLPAVAAPTPHKAAAPAVLTYTARHMRFFGRSSSGKLQLGPAQLSYTSADESVSLTRAQIRSIDGNGIVESSGKKWRFEIDGMTNDQVHDVLARWLANAPAAVSAH